MQVILLQPTTAAAISNPTQATKIGQTVTIICTGLQGNESAPLLILDPISGKYVPFYLNGQGIAFSSTNNVIGVEGAGSYCVNKPVTVAAVGISASALDF